MLLFNTDENREDEKVGEFVYPRTGSELSKSAKIIKTLESKWNYGLIAVRALT